MILLIAFAFLPFLAAYILPHDRKQIYSTDDCDIGAGSYGKVCSVTIGSQEFVIKTPKEKKFEPQEMASLLFTASRSTPFMIRPILLSFSTDGFILGMPKMLGNAFTLFPPHYDDKLNPQLQKLTTEQKLIDIINGIAELRRLGIAHNDFHRGNVVFDAQGHIYIIDFGESRFMRVETFERNKSKNNTNGNSDYVDFINYFKAFLKFFKDSNIKVENDWELIFELLNSKNENRKTFLWIAEQIKNNKLKLRK